MFLCITKNTNYTIKNILYKEWWLTLSLGQRFHPLPKKIFNSSYKIVLLCALS